MLKEGKKGSGQSVRNRRVLGALVVSEIALALVLLTGAGLMMRSFRSVREIDPGFDLENVLTLSLPLPPATYKDQQQQLRFYELALERLKALPGVESAQEPSECDERIRNGNLHCSGQARAIGLGAKRDYRTVSTNYFRAMGFGCDRA